MRGDGSHTGALRQYLPDDYFYLLNALHALAGISLLGLTVFSLVSSFRKAVISDQRWKILIAFTGLLLGFVLFTGFVQLGSRHSVHRFILYKLGSTMVGGLVVLLALIARFKDILNDFVIDLALVISIFLFGFSLYFGIIT